MSWTTQEGHAIQLRPDRDLVSLRIDRRPMRLRDPRSGPPCAELAWPIDAHPSAWAPPVLQLYTLEHWQIYQVSWDASCGYDERGILLLLFHRPTGEYLALAYAGEAFRIRRADRAAVELGFSGLIRSAGDNALREWRSRASVRAAPGGLTCTPR